MTEAELEIVRSAFARQILAVAGVAGNEALERAFRTVRREDFLGSKPWSIIDFAKGPRRLPSNDPVYACQDVVFVLAGERGVNNGSPALHARMLDALAPKPGETVVHLGAGTGYYSAILSHLVGPEGRVIAVEIDPRLAARAEEELQRYANVEVLVGDAAEWPQREADGVYVNFTVMAPSDRWIERLAPDGRLVVPLGVPAQPPRPGAPRFSRHGGAFLFRRDAGGGEYHASRLCNAFFIFAEGSTGTIDEAEEASLRDAFRGPGAEFVRSLVWKRPADPARCWISTPRWSLSYDPVKQ